MLYELSLDDGGFAVGTQLLCSGVVPQGNFSLNLGIPGDCDTEAIINDNPFVEESQKNLLLISLKFSNLQNMKEANILHKLGNP